jgi:hypothetical protein
MNSGCAPVPPRYEAVDCSRAFPVLFLLGVAAGAVLFCFDPERFAFYPICFFHQSTGLLCPGCGSLRAMHQLLHGHLVAALHLNALFVLALPFAGWLAARFVLRRMRNQPATFAIHPTGLWCALAVTFVFGLLRNLPFAQVAWLAP